MKVRTGELEFPPGESDYFGDKSLRCLIMQHVFVTLKKNAWCRTKTAVDLGVTRRCMSTYVAQMRALDWVCPVPEKHYAPRQNNGKFMGTPRAKLI